MSGKSYDTLLNEYNRVVANLKDITEQFEEKKNQWSKKEVYYNNLKDHVRELCEMILAKDRKENILGTNYSWYSMDAVELCSKAYISYINYNKERTNVMRKVIDISEQRRIQVESLQEQILILQSHSNVGELTEEQLDELRAVEIKNESSLPMDVAPNGIKIVKEEENDEDFTDGEANNIKTVVDLDASVKLTNNKEYIPSGKNKQKKKELKKQAIGNYMEDLSDILSKLTKESKTMLEFLGDTGKSEMTIIQSLLLAKYSDVFTNNSRITTTTKLLCSMGLLSTEKVQIPTAPNMSVLNVTEKGSRVYNYLFNKTCAISEKDKIIAMHDNAEHGYAILSLVRMLSTTEKYTNISMDERNKGVPVKGPNGIKNMYIPDVKVYMGKTVSYFEYERGTHTEKDFCAKLDKMKQVTRTLNIITQNNNATNKYKAWIDKYLEKKQDCEIENLIIRLATLKSVKEKGTAMINNEDYQIVYVLNNGKIPEIHY